MEFTVADYPILAQVSVVFNGQDVTDLGVVTFDPHIGSISCLVRDRHNNLELEGDGEPKTVKQYGIVKLALPKKALPSRRKEIYEALPGALKPYVIR